MSSSIVTAVDSWDVSNMMFWRVIDRACEVGRGLASTPEEQAWVDTLSRLKETVGTYSPDLAVEEVFPTTQELKFWIAVLDEYAQAIYERRIGNQENQTWQVWTIWAVCDLVRLLEWELRVERVPDGPPDLDPASQRYYALERQLRKLLTEQEEVLADLIPASGGGVRSTPDEAPGP
jgi:hypothetical protein